MKFRILGGVEAEANGRRLALRGATERKVLAILLLDADHMVPVTRLIDALWEDDPPVTAVKQAQNAVGRLRRLLAQSGEPGLVRTDGPGYRLCLDGNTVDARLFEAAIASADRAASEGNVAAAAAFLRSGLDLWRGPALAGLSGQVFQAAADALNERRCAAQETYYDHCLAFGDHRQVIGGLGTMISAHPFRETPAGQLMLALYRCGRQADALSVYDDLRQRLAAELGLDPSPELQRLQHQVLIADPDLAWVNQAGPVPNPPGRLAGLPTTGPDIPAPSQLPLDVADFTGRDSYLRQLDNLLRQQAAGTTPVVISAISGTAGVGKTALAVHWAHQIASRFPDGQLYIDLQGYAPVRPVDPAEALARFLRTLGVSRTELPRDVAEAAALFRSLLAGRRMLLVLDNAANSDQVRPLLPGSQGCQVVITSRDRLSGLAATHGARRVTLDVLSDRESVQLLARLLGEDRVRAESRWTAELARLCAHLPLAIRIAATNLADHPSVSIAGHVAKLSEGDRLAALQVPDDDLAAVRAAFHMSYERLSPRAGRLFRLLSVHPGPDISLPAVASLVGQSLRSTAEDLDGLIRSHLVTERIAGRFAWHDLLRLYAGNVASKEDSDADRRAAVGRVLDFYLHTSYLADRVLDSSRAPLDLHQPRPGTTPEVIETNEQALAWFEAERPVLLSVVSQASAMGFDSHAWQIPWSMTTFLDLRGYWHDWADTQRSALAAASRLRDLDAQARAHRCLANALISLGNCDDAHAELQASLAISRQLDDPEMEGDAHLNLGCLFARCKDYEKAISHSWQALERFRAAGHRGSQAKALNNVGWYHANVGNYELTVTYCKQALSVKEHPNTLDSLGYAHHRLGHFPQAFDCFERALDLYRDLGDRYFEALVLTHLGDAHQSASHPDAAADAWKQSLVILDDLRHPSASEIREKLSGHR